MSACSCVCMSIVELWNAPVPPRVFSLLIPPLSSPPHLISCILVSSTPVSLLPLCLCLLTSCLFSHRLLCQLLTSCVLVFSTPVTLSPLVLCPCLLTSCFLISLPPHLLCPQLLASSPPVSSSHRLLCPCLLTSLRPCLLSYLCCSSQADLWDWVTSFLKAQVCSACSLPLLSSPLQPPCCGAAVPGNSLRPAAAQAAVWSRNTR